MTSNFPLAKTLRRSWSLPPTRNMRVVVLGQSAVGKTAMTVRFITRRFIGDYDPTLVHAPPHPTYMAGCSRNPLKHEDEEEICLPKGLFWHLWLIVSTATETIYRHTGLIDGEFVHFEILDTAGQEEDSLQIAEKIKWGDSFVIVYSVTDRCSFDEVMRFCFLINHIHSASKKGVSEPTPIAIVGNKTDLQYDRMVSTDDGEKLSKALKYPFFEISTRDSYEQTVEVFHNLYYDLLRQGCLSPATFKKRNASKLMEKIPKLYANSTLISNGKSLSFNSFRDFIPE